MKKPCPAPRPRVVVVDDEPTVAHMLAIALSRSGFAALAVYSGRSAVQVCHVARPDILMIDILMPGMDGIETAAKVRELRPDCPILLFTGADVQENLQRLRAAGKAYEILEKPILPEELVSKAREHTAPVAIGRRKVA